MNWATTTKLITGDTNHALATGYMDMNLLNLLN